VAYPWRAAVGVSTPAHAGTSTHSFFGITLSHALSTSSKGLTARQANIGPLWFLFVDETSFISLEHLELVNVACTTAMDALQQVHGVESTAGRWPFGGIHLVAMGDPMQHECVRGTALHTQPRAGAPATTRLAHGQDLWRNMTHTVCLEKQHRMATAGDEHGAAGVQLQRFSSAFASENSCDVDAGLVSEFCHAFNAATVSSVADLAPLNPHVITLRNAVKLKLNPRLGILQAKHHNRRILVWRALDFRKDDRSPIHPAMAAYMLQVCNSRVTA